MKLEANLVAALAMTRSLVYAWLTGAIVQVAHMGGAKPNSKPGLRRVLHRGGISRTSVRKGIYHTPRPTLMPKQSGLCIPMLYRVTESLCVKMCVAMGVLLFADVHR